jgi:hypothetical protein
MAPFFDHLPTVGMALMNIGLGIGFGFVLEQAGFGNCNKLASQFYFNDQSVLKVMFTAIVTAMVLVFWATAVGIIDFDRIALNETFLWPQIIGGLLLGVGFIVGGYCPGTSVVSAATFKLDGLIFLVGCCFGIFVFGQTFAWYARFWESGSFGRFTLSQWLGWSDGVVVLLAVQMALGMFFGAEFLEKLLREPKSACRCDDMNPVDETSAETSHASA